MVMVPGMSPTNHGSDGVSDWLVLFVTVIES